MHRAQGSFQLGLELRPALAGAERIHILHHREQVGVLHAQEIIPQEITDPQQARQGIQHLGPLQRGQLIRPVRAPEQLADELAEMQQGRFGVGRKRQQVGEVLDQHGGGAQLALAVRIGDLMAVLIGHVQGILHPVADRVDRHPGDIDVVERQGIGELVQEAEGVQRVDPQHGVLIAGFIVDLDLDRVEGLDQAGAQQARFLQAGRHPDGQLTLRFAARPTAHHAQEARQVFGIAGPGIRLKLLACRSAGR